MWAVSTSHLGKGDAALSRFIPLARGVCLALSHNHHSNVSPFDHIQAALTLD